MWNNKEIQNQRTEIEELIWVTREKINRELAARKKSKLLTV